MFFEPGPKLLHRSPIVDQSGRAWFPEAAPCAEPLLSALQGSRGEAHDSNAPDLFRPHKATGLQHMQMLQERRHRHLEGLGQFADGRRAAAQALHHGPTCRISQGTEDGPEVGETVRHAPDHIVLVRVCLAPSLVSRIGSL